MSIKSDRWIKQQCMPPTHLIHRLDFKAGDPAHLAIEGVTHTKDLLTHLVRERVATEMTEELMSLYASKPMIEPFTAEQVKKRSIKTIGMEDGERGEERVISYGVSSYGYDVRCGREFKIFTNINNSIVDPKNFDEKSFVDFVGDVCIIPPNSFALARTMEYFRIPRDVLTICLGKSTYARCFTGDTKVALVDGTSVSFVEMVERYAKGERFWGYAVNADGLIVVEELVSPRKVGTEAVLKLTLDNGETISCTPDHKFMIRTGEYVEAKDLSPGVSLMPLYRTEARGYEAVYQPNQGRVISTHWLSDIWNIENGIYSHTQNSQRHHKDHNRRNNNPSNISRVSAEEHARHHNADRWSTQEARDEHGQKISKAIEQLSEDIDWFSNYKTAQSLRAEAFWNDPEYADAREKLLEKRENVSEATKQKLSAATTNRFSTNESRKKHSETMVKAWSEDSARREKQADVARTINLREEITEAAVRTAFAVAGSIRAAARYLKCDRSVFRRFPNVLSEFFGGPVAENHKVVSIEKVEGEHDVYCLTVPGHGNFALEAGVFVKNCGIIVNVTPLEPEWEGEVTLEFSNTTNLPAKIYAGEGVAQMLFLQSDESCEVSYKDRSGKYQGQTGVTVPRT